MVLRDQHAGQDGVCRLARVSRLIVGVEPRSTVQAAASSHLTSSSRARDAGTGLSRSTTSGRVRPRGLGDRLQRPGWIALRLPDPARSARPVASGCVRQLAAQRVPSDVTHRGVEIASLVGHFGHAHVRDAGGRQRRAARTAVISNARWYVSSFRVQVALDAVDLAEVLAQRGDLEGAPAACRRSMISGGIGIRQPAGQPIRRGQVPADQRRHHRLAIAEFDQRPQANAVVASMSPRSSARNAR